MPALGVPHDSLRDGPDILGFLQLIGGEELRELAPPVVVFLLEGEPGCLVDPGDLPAEVRATRILGNALDDIRVPCPERLLPQEPVRVLVGLPARDVLVAEVGADEARELVAGGNPNELERRTSQRSLSRPGYFQTRNAMSRTSGGRRK
jgi:hypothetical protein